MGEQHDGLNFDLEGHLGETVTIFTTSGGESGSGFTGVLIQANCFFVRLITRIGPPPGCALGNSCCGWSGGWPRRDCSFIRTLGDVVDIPVNKIAAVVFNTV